MLSLTQQLRSQSDLRILRMVIEESGDVTIWLALRQPIPLLQMLSEMEGVSSVRRTPASEPSADSNGAALTLLLV